jgi:hypothetical protein
MQLHTEAKVELIKNDIKSMKNKATQSTDKMQGKEIFINDLVDDWK